MDYGLFMEGRGQLCAVLVLPCLEGESVGRGLWRARSGRSTQHTVWYTTSSTLDLQLSAGQGRHAEAAGMCVVPTLSTTSPRPCAAPNWRRTTNLHTCCTVYRT